MITTTVKETQKRKYPYIGKWEGRIVLFLERNQGLLLEDKFNDCAIKKGEISNGLSEGEYEVFRGEVILKNS